MANYFIFGIGGTGSRVIRSFTMLLGAGFSPFKATDRVFPILIDFDTKNGDTQRAKDLMAVYHSIHEAAYPHNLRVEEKLNELFFSTPLYEMQEVSPACRSSFTMDFGTESSQTFEQWTAANHLRDHKATSDLLLSLYDDSSDDNTAELKLKMNLGFKGNPNIGSIVFHSLKETEEFSDFTSLCQAGDKVIIVGSLFGGTGSSGIPELVQAIRTNNRPEVRDVDLSVIMVCPYFAFKSSDERAVRSSIFKSKTKAALNFYATSGLNDMINAIYYVGDDNPTIFEYCEGGEKQTNKIHVVDFVSALSIFHFAERSLRNDDQPLGRYNNTDKKVEDINGLSDTRYYKYRFSELSEEEIAISDEEKDEFQNGLNFSNFIESELARVFYPLSSFAIALRFFHDEVAQKTKLASQLDWFVTLGLAECFHNGNVVTGNTGDPYVNQLRQCCSGLMDFYEFFRIWNEEFQRHSSHGLFLYNFDSGKPLSDFIAGIDFKETSAGFLGMGKSTKSLLDMEEDVAEGTKNAWKDMRAVNTFSVDSQFKAFMLLSVLTNGCREVFIPNKNNKKKDNGRAEERRKKLETKTLKVVDATAAT